MITDAMLHAEVKKMIEGVGGKLRTPEDVTIAFAYVEAQLNLDVAREKAKIATHRLITHFDLVPGTKTSL